MPPILKTHVFFVFLFETNIICQLLRANSTWIGKPLPSKLAFIFSLATEISALSLKGSCSFPQGVCTNSQLHFHIHLQDSPDAVNVRQVQGKTLSSSSV